MSTSFSVETSVVENLRRIFEDATGEVLSINLDEQATSVLIEILADNESESESESPSVRLLAGEEVLKWLRDDFVLASAAAELIEAGTLDIRTATESLQNMLVVTEATVVSLLTPDDEHSAALGTDDEEFVAAARERWYSAWEGGEKFDLRTPAYSRVLNSLAEEFGPEMESDFRTVLDSLASTREESDLDEVEVSLLVAAKHGQLQYDISKWGENVGVASKATFSRTKTQLEEQGLLDTEKVPIDVGRPRLRLVLGEKRLQEAEAEELASVVRELLSAAPA